MNINRINISTSIKPAFKAVFLQDVMWQIKALNPEQIRRMDNDKKQLKSMLDCYGKDMVVSEGQYGAIVSEIYTKPQKAVYKKGKLIRQERKAIYNFGYTFTSFDHFRSSLAQYTQDLRNELQEQRQKRIQTNINYQYEEQQQ